MLLGAFQVLVWHWWQVAVLGGESPSALSMLVAIVVPGLLLSGLWAWKNRPHGRQPEHQTAAALAAVEALDETSEIDL